MKSLEMFDIREMQSGSKTVYLLQGYKPNGERVRKRFNSYSKALGAKHELEVEAINQGGTIMPRMTRLTDAQLADAEKAIADLPEGATLREAAVFFARAYVRPDHDKRLSEARAEFALDPVLLEHMRAGTRDAITLQVRQLERTLPAAIRVHEVGREAIERLIARDKLQTARTRRNKLSSFFNWCLLKGYAGKNPVTGALRPPERKARLEKEPAILSMDEVKRLLKAAQGYKDGALVPYLSLHLFGGLRAEECKKIDWSDIDLPGGYVILGASIAKTGLRRAAKMPKNLRAWLDPHALKQTRICPRNFRKDFDKVRELAGIKTWERDVGRHTALTFHYADSGLKSTTAAWAGNSPQILDRHYRHAGVTAEAASLYWALTPQSISKDNTIKLPENKPESKPEPAQAARKQRRAS